MNTYYNNFLHQLGVDLYFSRLTLCIPEWGADNITCDFNKFYYFLGGEGKLIIEGDTYYPKPGEWYLIPKGTQHSYSHNPNKPIFQHWCHFSMKFGNAPNLKYTKDTIRCIPDESIIKPLFEKLNTLNDSSDMIDIVLQKSCLLTMCHLFFTSVNFKKMIAIPSDDFYNIISSFISNHISDPISINHLAGIVHLQPNYFITKFKKSFGTTPIDYIKSQRLGLAAQKIISMPDESIENIAQECGFSDYRYFDRVFKKRFSL